MASTSSSSAPSASLLKNLLSILSSVKGDLSNITIPPFFLAPKSVTQIPASWAERPTLFSAPAHEPDPSKRALLVLKFWLTSLRTQFYVDGDLNSGSKKPLNAFLGEIYSAMYTDAEGENSARIVSEQVSHHPPITATHIAARDDAVTADGYARVEMTFHAASGVSITQYGHAMLHVDKYNEDYLMPFPEAQIKGIMSGRFYPELVGTLRIVSTSGWVSEVVFGSQQGNGEGKGGLLGMKKSGGKNEFHATVFRNEDPDRKAVYSAAGCWSDSFVIRDEAGAEMETIDTAVSPSQPQFDDDASDPWETQVAWKEVMAHLRSGDMKAAGDEKNALENAQRELRKKVPEEQWKPLFFEAKQEEWYPTFDRLAPSSGGMELQREKTKGVWRYVGSERGGEVKRPFHGSLKPMGE